MLVAGVAAFFLLNFLFSGPKRYTGLKTKVKSGLFKIMIVQKGELQSSNNNDIQCQVKTNRGTDVKINYVIEDGTEVLEKRWDLGPACVIAQGLSAQSRTIFGGTPAVTDLISVSAAADYKAYEIGDLLVELDVTPLEKERDAQQIKVDQANADAIQAENEYEITVSQGESDMATAVTTKILAEIMLKKYENGDYKVKEKQIESRKLIAESNFRLWKDRVYWSERMKQKGYITESQLESDKAKVLSAFLDTLTADLELKALSEYEKAKEVTDLKNQIKLAELLIKQTTLQNEAKAAQAMATKKAKRSIYLQELALLNDTKAQIANCRIYAPRSGLAIHYVSPQARWGRGSSQNIVAVGEPVDYNQKLIQIPDLEQMIVKAKIPEAQVAYLRNQENHQQKAWVKVEAFSSRAPYPAYVSNVATIASQNSWYSSDVKVYDAEITIDAKVSDLRPGMSAEVSILAYQSEKPHLQIPLEAVVGSITSGKERQCFVIGADGYPHKRNIVLGKSNETHVIVLEGLQEGEELALDPASLLPPDSNLRAYKGPKKKSFSKQGGGPPKGKSPGEGKKTGNQKTKTDADPKSPKKGNPGGNPKQAAAPNNQDPAMKAGQENKKKPAETSAD